MIILIFKTQANYILSILCFLNLTINKAYTSMALNEKTNHSFSFLVIWLYDNTNWIKLTLSVSWFLVIWFYLCIKAQRRKWHPTLAWKISWMEDPGRPWSMVLLRVRHDWLTSLSIFTFTHWRRKWQPTPVFLPGESQGRQSLVGCRLWGRTESDMTEVTWQQQHVSNL